MTTIERLRAAGFTMDETTAIMLGLEDRRDYLRAWFPDSDPILSEVLALIGSADSGASGNPFSSLAPYFNDGAEVLAA